MILCLIYEKAKELKFKKKIRNIFIIVSFPSFLSYQLKQFRITHKFELGNGEQSALILFVEKKKQKRSTNILGLVFFNVSMLCLFIYFYHFCAKYNLFCLKDHVSKNK